MRYLLLAALVSSLSGCAKPEISSPHVAPCAPKQVIPKGDLTGPHAAILWNRDRAALDDCAAKVAAFLS